MDTCVPEILGLGALSEIALEKDEDIENPIDMPGEQIASVMTLLTMAMCDEKSACEATWYTAAHAKIAQRANIKGKARSYIWLSWLQEVHRERERECSIISQCKRRSASKGRGRKILCAIRDTQKGVKLKPGVKPLGALHRSAGSFVWISFGCAHLSYLYEWPTSLPPARLQMFHHRW